MWELNRQAHIHTHKNAEQLNNLSDLRKYKYCIPFILKIEIKHITIEPTPILTSLHQISYKADRGNSIDILTTKIN